MDPEFDTEDGGEELSVEQAANAFLKSQDKGTEDGHPEAGEIEEELEEADDDLQESDEDESFLRLFWGLRLRLSGGA